MWILALLLWPTQDYMKMLQPAQETAQDREVLQLLGAIDQAVAQKKTPEAQELTKKLQTHPTARKSLEVLIKSRDPMTRALGAYGFRLLPVKGGFKEKLQYLLMDPQAMVRQQVLMYVAQEPAGVDVQSVQLSLSDGAAPVRAAAVGAVVRTAKKERAVQLLKQRFSEEKDPTVIQAIRVGFTAMGLPSPDAQP